MGLEFIEYNRKRVPLKASDICFCLSDYAKDYIKEDREAIKGIDPKIRDAVLVDAINYVGAAGSTLFGLYTKDLYDGTHKGKRIGSQVILAILYNWFGKYMFAQSEGKTIVDSVLRNQHMNEINEPFDATLGARVLVDFMNYILKVRGYDKVFTLNEIYEGVKRRSYICEMERLRELFEKVNKIYNKLLTESNKSELVFTEQDLENFYNGIAERRRKAMGDKWAKYTGELDEISEDSYALAYAYVKVNEGQMTTIPEINVEIREMRKK